MRKPGFIAGDWGTSNLRLHLCRYREAGAIELLDSRSGPGIRESQGDFEEQLFGLVQAWLDQYGPMPILLSGMVGSNIGWRQAPYLSCPIAAAEIANGRLSFSTRGVEISILAGLSTTNPLQAPDIMRGEELQLLGWLQSNPGRTHETCLFALPGTHNKWAWVENSRISTFLTAYTGELFGLLCEHSVLISVDSVGEFNQDAFMQGVAAIQNLDGAHLVHALFSTRSKQVSGRMPASDGPDYLSGLLIGADVLGAIKLFTQKAGATFKLIIIGEPELARRYRLVFEYLQLNAEICEPVKIAVAGFQTIYENLYLNPG